MTAPSKWYSTPQEARKRKPLTVTLSDEAREMLEALAEGRPLSELVEALVRDRADVVAALGRRVLCHGQAVARDAKCPVCRRFP